MTDGTNGIPGDSPTWVVREDKERKGLLYAGTEFGLYVSFNDGQNWQSLQQNLPVTRIPDIKVHDNDLVVATHGRSFWIMDDLSPLRQVTEQTEKKNMHLYNPGPAYLVRKSRGGDAEDREPEGPKGGAAFDYMFKEKPDTTVTLEILNDEGKVIRTYTSDSAKSEEAGEPVLPVKKGHTRFHWNLFAKGVKTVGETMLWETAGIAGLFAIPGTYQVRLSVEGGGSQTQTFQVRKDPRCKEVTQEDFREQQKLALELKDSLNSIYNAIRTIRSVREQVNSVVSHAKEAGHKDPDIKEMAEAITKNLTKTEHQLLQTKNESFQDPLNFPPKLKSQYAFLYNYVNSPSAALRGPIPPTSGARERLAELNEKWTAIRDGLQNVLDTKVAEFNKKVDDLGEPVFLPKFEKK
jgi:hypothetical protein